MPVIPKPSTSVAIDNAAAEFQAVIDGESDAIKDLIAQRDAIKAQITTLVQQRAELDKQIAAAEPEDVKQAKSLQKLMDIAKNNPERLRRFGII